MSDTCCQSEHLTHSSQTRSPQLRQWKSDDEYIDDQDRDSSWSHKSPWGQLATLKFVHFGRKLGERLCHDDTVADFGGNDGTASYGFYVEHKIKPLVIDCEPKRLEFAEKVYSLSTYQSFIEHMPELADKSIDWGFTSHTIEHLRDVRAGLREIARVVRRGCCFVVPLERKSHAMDNHAHAICFTQPRQWKKLLNDNGWNVLETKRAGDHEVHIFAAPR